MVLINVVEETIKPGIRDTNSCLRKCSRKLFLIQVAILIPIYGFEQCPELSFCVNTELREVYARQYSPCPQLLLHTVECDAAIVIDICYSQYLSYQTIGILKS